VPLRSAASVLLLVRLGEEHGVPAEQSLAGTGTALEDLRRPGAEVQDDVELAVIARLAAAPDAVDLALEAGTRYHLTTFGIWGFALASSPDVGSALEVGLRFADLSFTFCRFSVEARGEQVLLCLDDSAVPEAVRDFVVTRDLAAMRTIVTELTGDTVPLRRVELRPARPADVRRHVEVLGVEPDFGAPVTLVAVDASALGLPLPQADELAAATTQAQCKALLEQRLGRTGTAGAVRDLLLQSPASLPDTASAAGALALSERTLRRRLADEGTSFRALVEEVREALAEELLATGLPVEQVARRLGYAETASFTHAFTRWKGSSPRAWSRGRR
jgi:AraC-like DNA-binding protein